MAITAAALPLVISVADDGQTALSQFLDRLADIPTPSGPTPRQLLPIVEVRRDADDDDR
ncbi:hypothetical protein ACFXC8_31110 [Streptomyces sp. NPDC059441]|uniref:hypothetical protein n=1 Tax=Streptomyces sp. NPDC059441 TaxID=3346829 RepID=UPI003694FB33